MNTMQLSLFVLSIIVLIQLVYSQPGNLTGATLTFSYPFKRGGVNYPEHDLFAAGVHVHNVKHVVFNARGRHDAHILLKKDRNDFHINVVEIVLGGSRNSKSVIRDVQQGYPAKASKRTRNILSRYKYRTFWASWVGACIRFEDGLLLKAGCEKSRMPLIDDLSAYFSACFKIPSVGRGHRVGEGEIMAWCGNKQHPINYISASFGYSSGGHFQFLKTATELSYYSVFSPGSVDYPKHDLFADGIDIRSSKSIVFTAQGRNDAHVLLKQHQHNYQASVIEIVFGGWGNTQSVIRDRQQGPNKAFFLEKNLLSAAERRYFWISWENNCIKVGKGYSVGKQTKMSWCGKTHDVNFVSASYGFGSDGYFQFTKTAGAP